jgi:hypothetical protein
MYKGNLIELIRNIVAKETKFHRTFLGKVVDVNDPLQQGRVKAQIGSLGWDSDDKAIWCNPTDKNAIITAKRDDWIRISFLNGNINLAYYLGFANEVTGVLPVNYDGLPTTQVLYEDNNEEFYIKYDELTKEFIIEDSHGNVIEMKAGQLNIDGTLINLLGATEAFVKGNEFQTRWTTFNTTVQTATSGTTGQNAAGIETIKAAFATFTAAFSNLLSTTIKGE